MPILLLLLFIIAFPLVEIYFLIEVGSVIGAIPTIAITLFTAVFGIYFIRLQGLKTILKAQESLKKAEVPMVSLYEGVLLFVAAIFLLIPGLVSDSLGAILLIPPARHFLASSIHKYRQLHPTSSSAQYFHHSTSSKDYIDGEYEDVSKGDPLKIEKDHKL